VRIWILSDLHLELTRGWDLPSGAVRPGFDVLVVAGDLIPRMERGVKWLAQRVTDKPCIYLPGNHEPYGRDIDIDLEKARAAAVGTDVHVLQNDTVVIGGITFVGATCEPAALSQMRQGRAASAGDHATTGLATAPSSNRSLNDVAAGC
jgi:hypothetical protein